MENREEYLFGYQKPENLLELSLFSFSFSFFSFHSLSLLLSLPDLSLCLPCSDADRANSGQPWCRRRSLYQAHPTPSPDPSRKRAEAQNPRANRASSQRLLLPLFRTPPSHHLRASRTFLVARRPQAGAHRTQADSPCSGKAVRVNPGQLEVPGATTRFFAHGHHTAIWLSSSPDLPPPHHS